MSFTYQHSHDSTASSCLINTNDKVRKQQEG